MTKLIDSNYGTNCDFIFFVLYHIRKFNAFYWLSSIMTINDYLNLMTKISFAYQSQLKRKFAEAVAKILFITLDYLRHTAVKVH